MEKITGAFCWIPVVEGQEDYFFLDCPPNGAAYIFPDDVVGEYIREGDPERG